MKENTLSKEPNTHLEKNNANLEEDSNGLKKNHNFYNMLEKRLRNGKVKESNREISLINSDETIFQYKIIIFKLVNKDMIIKTKSTNQVVFQISQIL